MRHLTFSFFFCLTVCLAGCQTQQAAKKLPDNVSMERTIPLASSSRIIFSVPQKTKVTMQLLPNPYTPRMDRIAATLTLQDVDCKVGHQGSIFYRKTWGETQYEYFTKELPWNTNGELAINHNDSSNEISITLNGETHVIHPQVRANYLRITSYPHPVTIVEPAN